MKKLLLLFVLVAAIFGSDKIVVKSTKIMDENNASLGFIHPGVSVSVLETKDNVSLIKFSGVMDECCPKVYKDFNKSQLGVSVYDKTTPKVISQISKNKNSVEILGYVSEDALNSDDKSIKALANDLYTGKCAQCHIFFSSDSFTSKEWISIMKDMRDRADISDHDGEVLLYYLQENSLSVK